MKISDVAIPNPNNTPDSDWEFINYLDTGSCTRNEITVIQKLFKGEFPSRAKRVVKNNDVIISTVRPNLCHYAILKDTLENMVVSTGFTVLTAKENVIPEYLYFFLTQKKVTERLSVIADGATTSYPSINPEDILNLEINPHDKKEQRKISDILSVIDEKISINNRINSELETMAKTIYNYWFIQFDFPNEEGKPYKSSGGEMEWNEVLKREIPKGWAIKNISEIEPNIITGKTPATEVDEYFNGTIPFITIPDIRGNIFIVKTEKTLSKIGANTQPNKFLPANSICVSCIASPGLVGFVTKPSQTNQQINSVICENEFNRYFLYFSIKHFFEFSFGAKIGNTFVNMNKEEFCAIKLIYPLDSVVKKFHDTITAYFRTIKLKSQENQELINLRDFLLPLLMNGQVKVK